jgi:DnaJ-class molecular chaperone
MLGTCPACQGAGQVIDDPCNDCRGQGLAKVQSELEIDIPAGGMMVADSVLDLIDIITSCDYSVR